MLPSSEIRWLRRGAISVGLLLAFLALIAAPSRHAVLDVWPARMQELVLADGKVKIMPATAQIDGLMVLARTHPQALLVLEFHDGHREHGFLLQVDPETAIWSVQTIDGLRQIDPGALRQAYAPNDLTVLQRARLARQRLMDRRILASNGLADRFAPDGGQADLGAPDLVSPDSGALVDQTSEP